MLENDKSLVQTRCPCLGTEMDVVQTCQCPRPVMFIDDSEKVLTSEKSVTNLELVL